MLARRRPGVLAMVSCLALVALAGSVSASEGLATTEGREPVVPIPNLQESLRTSDSPMDAGGRDAAQRQAEFEVAMRQYRAGDIEQARKGLEALLRSNAPEDIQRSSLLELARIAEGEGLLSRAQQILAQYAARFPQHPSVVEVHLRQGELCRRMGSRTLAISKFYAVMTSALRLRVDQLEEYQKLVLRAQIEIAETHYRDGRWEDAAGFLQRILKLDSPHLNRAEIRYKLIRSLAMLERHEETTAQARSFLEDYPDATESAEVRFTLARALKRAGQTQEALREVLVLLESQRTRAPANPEVWAYWQKRAGNEIGNQLYSEGDYPGTLAIYQRLSDLDSSGAWQVPVWYQLGLVYERLGQPARARELYSSVIERENEMGGTNSTPALQAILDMARWRRDNLNWHERATAGVAALRQQTVTNLPGIH
jgi:tetratricopeptide (TPR) repeat protein